ncbi:MAG: transcriptional regulator [Rhodospirillales bacterium CG15_BIG_FIL_POST_REV_8_21_14_020_66_15]|nr:MAG: transcriptional regulator [Rhodospirillales bacterium CG15_BIG_FIL_POST_REV_8_21_14_020_66_15]
MKEPEFAAVFSALAHDLRLAVFRLLMQAGPNGLRAGEISTTLGVPPSTLSAHLAQMAQAGLLRATRQRQQIIYAVDVEGTRRLITYLTEDCCQGRPEICGYGNTVTCTSAVATRREEETSDE